MVSLLPILNNPRMAYAAAPLVVVVLFLGCQSSNPSGNLSRFRAAHPDEAAKYSVLAPTSVEYMEYACSEHYDTVKTIIQGVRKFQDNPEELARYLDYLEKANDCSDRNSDPEWSQFKQRLRAGDLLMFFEYRSNGYNDFGLLVLRDGGVKYRAVWGWNLSQPNGEANPPPAGMNFDQL